MSMISNSSSEAITPSTSSTSRELMARLAEERRELFERADGVAKAALGVPRDLEHGGFVDLDISAAATWLSTRAMSWTRGRRKSKRWQRERMVAGILCASVVASTKTTCGGGSSSVFSRALKASLVSMWTSSTM